MKPDCILCTNTMTSDPIRTNTEMTLTIESEDSAPAFIEVKGVGLLAAREMIRELGKYREYQPHCHHYVNDDGGVVPTFTATVLVAELKQSVEGHSLDFNT